MTLALLASESNAVSSAFSTAAARRPLVHGAEIGPSDSQIGAEGQGDQERDGEGGLERVPPDPPHDPLVRPRPAREDRLSLAGAQEIFGEIERGRVPPSRVLGHRDRDRPWRRREGSCRSIRLGSVASSEMI